MHIDSPQFIWFFWFLPVVLVFFLFFERKRRAILHSVYPKHLIGQRLPQYSPLSHVLRFVYFMLALFFLAAALLKPYADFEIREVKQRGADLYFLVDVSHSMLAADIKPSRLERAKREIVDFLALLRGDRVGLIGFAGTSYVFVPLTSDKEALNLFAEELHPDLLPVPGTDIAGAIQKAVNSFQKQTQSSSRGMILITDGEDTVGLDENTINAIKEHGIALFVIGIGTPEGAPIPMEEGGYKTDQTGNVVVSRLSESALQNLALATGGGYVRSVTGDLDLEQIYFQGIKKTLQEGDLKSQMKRLPDYEFQIFLLLACVFLTMEILTTNRRKFWISLLGRKSFRRLGMLMVGAGLFLSASSARALVPFNAEKGREAYENERYEEALKHYLDALEKRPHDTKLHFNAGDAAYKLNRFEEAEKSYMSALNAEDADTRKQALYNLGNTRFRQNDLKGALAFYEKALQMDADYQKARLNHDYVKKLLEQQEQQKQEQEQQEQEQQGQEQQQEQQQQEEKKDDQQNDEQQGKSGQDQQQKDEERGEGQKAQGEQEKAGETQEEETAQQDAQAQPGKESQSESAPLTQQGSNDKGQTVFEFDQIPEAWLENLPDEPQNALLKMIERQTEKPRKRIEKDW